jgi:hypothetical protein
MLGLRSAAVLRNERASAGEFNALRTAVDLVLPTAEARLRFKPGRATERTPVDLPPTWRPPP